MPKLVANLTENARVFVETRKLLGYDQVIKVVEEEGEQARELAAEFYGDAPRLPAVTTDNSEGIRASSGMVELQPKLPPAIPSGENQKNPKPKIREPRRKPVPRAPNSTPGEASAATVKASKPLGPNSGADTTTVQGIVGALEPDASGNTIRKTSSGSEYVVFAMGNDGSSTKIYCNRPELVPEIAQRQGREAVAEVAVASENGRQYHLLNGFREGRR